MGERTENCFACRFYATYASTNGKMAKGYCRRFPPIVRQEYWDSIHPEVAATDWCGEFQDSGIIQKYEAIPVDSVGFSKRTKRLLGVIGLTTLGQITKQKQSDLLKWRGLGRHSFCEIQNKLHEHGLALIDEAR